jgi:hypothetical protein
MFLLLRKCAPVVYRNIDSVVASCNTNNFFFRHQDFQSSEKKKAKIKCLLIGPKLQKLLVIQYLNLLGDMPNRIQLPLMKQFFGKFSKVTASEYTFGRFKFFK